MASSNLKYLTDVSGEERNITAFSEISQHTGRRRNVLHTHKRWYSSKLLLLLLIAGLTTHSAGGQAKPATFGYLETLAGTWTMPTKVSKLRESWVKLNDSTWEGKTWRIINGDTSLQQAIRIVREQDGIFVMPVYTGLVTATPIRLQVRVLKAAGFVAENKENEFPTKIMYRFRDTRHLDARVEGRRDGTIQEFIFQYSKD